MENSHLFACFNQISIRRFRITEIEAWNVRRRAKRPPSHSFFLFFFLSIFQRCFTTENLVLSLILQKSMVRKTTICPPILFIFRFTDNYQEKWGVKIYGSLLNRLYARGPLWRGVCALASLCAILRNRRFQTSSFFPSLVSFPLVYYWRTPSNERLCWYLVTSRVNDSIKSYYWPNLILIGSNSMKSTTKIDTNPAVNAKTQTWHMHKCSTWSWIAEPKFDWVYLISCYHSNSCAIF